MTHPKPTKLYPFLTHVASSSHHPTFTSRCSVFSFTPSALSHLLLFDSLCRTSSQTCCCIFRSLMSTIFEIQWTEFSNYLRLSPYMSQQHLAQLTILFWELFFSWLLGCLMFLDFLLPSLVTFSQPCYLPQFYPFCKCWGVAWFRPMPLPSLIESLTIIYIYM